MGKKKKYRVYDGKLWSYFFIFKDFFLRDMCFVFFFRLLHDLNFSKDEIHSFTA